MQRKQSQPENLTGNMVNMTVVGLPIIFLSSFQYDSVSLEITLVQLRNIRLERLVYPHIH